MPGFGREQKVNVGGLYNLLTDPTETVTCTSCRSLMRILAQPIKSRKDAKQKDPRSGGI